MRRTLPTLVVAAAIACSAASACTSQSTGPPAAGARTSVAPTSAAPSASVNPSAVEKFSGDPSTNGVYPLNWEKFLRMEVAGPSTVRPGQTVRLVVAVTNHSGQELDNYDLTLQLLAAPDGLSPLDFVVPTKVTPNVEFTDGYRTEWRVGPLLPLSRRLYLLEVRVPANIRLAAVRYCWIGYQGIIPQPGDGQAQTGASWSDQAERPACATIRR